MILTGKSKEDFLRYILSEFDITDKEFGDIYLETMSYGIIINWFDYVGIYIHVDNLTNVVLANGEHAWKSYIKRRFKNRIKCSKWSITRQHATEAAIIKANEIYNSRK